MITPTVSSEKMVEIIMDGINKFKSSQAVYIRPMYWAIEGGDLAIVPKKGLTGFAICLEDIPMADSNLAATLTTTRFRRPVLEDNVVNAKAGCLYPNNARMLAEARDKGFSNALVADIMGNVAETATANGYKVHEKVISFTDVDNADEVFMSGNMMKVTPVKAFNSTNYQIGPITKKTRELYWDWAKSI